MRRTTHQSSRFVYSLEQTPKPTSTSHLITLIPSPHPTIFLSPRSPPQQGLHYPYRHQSSLTTTTIPSASPLASSNQSKPLLPLHLSPPSSSSSSPPFHKTQCRVPVPQPHGANPASPRPPKLPISLSTMTPPRKPSARSSAVFSRTCR